MAQVPWTHPINFASALLLHSCMTVMLKEASNALELGRRLLLRSWHTWPKVKSTTPNVPVSTSAVLDAYTSIVSCDQDGELAELYFTNTGGILLAISLASSVAMNLLLSDAVLNTLIASTFGLAFVASLLSIDKGYTLPIMALRRAGRFIWSDTPFVNFFSLIYIATVLHGKSKLRLQDYVAFRCIAILELLFMKAKLAASTPEKQMDLLTRLVASEWVVMTAPTVDAQTLPPSSLLAERNSMQPFTTKQRLSLMFLKTSIGFHQGCLQGRLGPAWCSVPSTGFYTDDVALGYRIYRLSETIAIIADQPPRIQPTSRWARFIARAHGVLLRQVGKVRVIYLLRTVEGDAAHSSRPLWHSNVNLVTGVSKAWLEHNYTSTRSRETCVVAGRAEA